ncbi:MAG TPA: 4'-phosphopantetheinyl transferase superfamily protein [Rhizomicrobium sp.]|jgi:phosphopantetheine--protein transferase-like protein
MMAREAVLSRIVPSGVAAAEIEDIGQPVALHPDEAGYVSKSGDVRLRDFTLGRHCAHAVLARLGQPDFAIAPDANGAPIWPEGIIGSITHTKGYAAALAGRTDMFLAVGVDAERIGGVTENLYSRLFTAAECVRLSMQDAKGRGRDATILFSAKEAVYKACNNLAGGERISFQDIDITLTGDRFRAILVTGQITGRFIVSGDLAVTAAWLPRL